MARKRITDVHLLNNALAQQESASTTVSSERNLLAIDWGEKFCGFAFSPDGMVVLALEVCPSGDFSETLQRIIEQKDITKLIWGVPRGLSENLVVQRVKKLIKTQELPSKLIDERGSSQLCVSGNKSERIDDLAAAQILEFYLDQK